VPSEPDLRADGQALRDEQELLIDRIETQRFSHTKRIVGVRSPEIALKCLLIII
jgi:hypothetical protein